MSEWKDKVIVITGAGSGIGKALAEHFAVNEAKLVLTDINNDNLQLVCRQLHHCLLCSHALDVTSTKDWEALKAMLVEQVGYVDIVINNAGMSNFDYFTETPPEQFDRVLDVNLNGVVYGCRYMLPLLLNAKSGLIVNVSSIFGAITVPAMTAYHTSKFAVRGFSSALQQDMKYQGFPIKVVCVMPGGIKTNIARNSLSENRDFDKYVRHFDNVAYTTPKRAAQVIAKGMRKRKPQVLVGPDAKFANFLQWLLGNAYHRVTNALLGVNNILK
jgi:NADP-dependent 3-hydroxy acid dehydrogenase YdfG